MCYVYFQFIPRKLNETDKHTLRILLGADERDEDEQAIVNTQEEPAIWERWCLCSWKKITMNDLNDSSRLI